MKEEKKEKKEENIPVFGDEDKDGDIDRDDYMKKFGGGTRKEGKATEAEIQEGITRAKQEQEAEEQFEKRQEEVDPVAKADPDMKTVKGTGTAFEGDMAGVDQEFYYNEPTTTTAPMGKQQPATDVKTSILSQFEQNTEDEGERMEDVSRNKKSVEQLKQEIRCFHLLYEDKIKSIQSPEHQKDYDEAMKSNDLKKVKEHHKMMSKMIRAYYKVANLKLGVIMSAESVFGGAVGNIPSMMGSFG
ncbi:MAG: hypothetical protein GY915_04600, partial [bacterium]|nr:hypothetical protein [bacterium]